MTLYEMKRKVLALIEELSPDSPYLTDDPDIQAKMNPVINQLLFEMARFKKIPRYVEIPVTQGQTLTFADLERACGSEIYQLEMIAGVPYIPRAQGTVLKFLGTGTAEIDLFIYPERITERTPDKTYEFELSPDALEVLPYGIAADLLRSDVSAQYGSVYAARYNEMLQRLDHRYQLGSFLVEGGIGL